MHSSDARGLRMILAVFAMLAAVEFLGPSAQAQQFNTDNYLSMPYGTATFLITHGARNSTVITSFSLAPKWEFFATANLYWKRGEEQATEHFSTNLYAKRMFYENAAQNGGFAVMGGVGNNPAYYKRGEITNSFETFWASAPLSLPFAKGLLLLDIMPGFQVDFDRGVSKATSTSFTHSTRLAVYHIVPQSAIVGEVYGSVGSGFSNGEYKAGVRWEPNKSFALAVTYGHGLDGSPGAGFEVGFMLFTPRFLCRGGCK